MARGRHAEPERIVAGSAGSRSAKERLLAMLQTLAGATSIGEAARPCHVGRSRFCLQRRAMLQAALAFPEPRTRGRPPIEPGVQERRIAALEAQVQALKIDLRAAQIREELALVLPHVLKPKSGGRKKTSAVSDAASPGALAAGLPVLRRAEQHARALYRIGAVMQTEQAIPASRPLEPIRIDRQPGYTPCGG